MTSTQTDRMEKLCGALIQHGPLSQRIYLMKLKDSDPRELIPALDKLAQDNGYTKIFAKVSAEHADVFIEQGYRIEARVPCFYNGLTEAFFLAYYLDHRRSLAPNADQIQGNIALARRKAYQSSGLLDEQFSLRLCNPDDVDPMSVIYREVFESYPFPIHDPDYLRQTMADNICYYGVWLEDKLIALSSSEMDEPSKNVEMTDFATLPDYRGLGLATHLLKVMERDMTQRGIQMAYTIARAASAGMNITFARQAYTFGGTLINNTNIAGTIESMNVWFKRLV